MGEFGPGVRLDNPAFIHPSAQIYGNVVLHEGTSIWPNAVIRAESFEIEVGAYTNIQDFVMVHVGMDRGTRVGEHCSLTHRCTLHGATVGDNCLIGINATLMDDCVIGDNSIVAGGSFLPEGTVVPPNSVVMGVPGRVRATRNNWIGNRFNAALYHRNALAYAAGAHRAWDGAEHAAFVAAEMVRLEAAFAASS